jgi:hypothetical protein
LVIIYHSLESVRLHPSGAPQHRGLRTFERLASLMRWSLTLIFLAALLVGCSKTTVHKVPQATGGSKADGTIRLAYEELATENVVPDWTRAKKNALKRCQAWGYSRVEAFAGSLTQCTEVGQGLLINGAVPGACARQIVYIDYQCLGTGADAANPPPTSSTVSRSVATGSGVSSGRTSNRWIGDGPYDACGVPWAMDLSISSGSVSGTLWRDEVAYDVRGKLDTSGQMSDGRAAKSRTFAAVPAPRFLALELAVFGEKANGVYAINSAGSMSCRTRFVLRPF